jgi:Methylamine utilisation protein MauE
MSVDPSVPLAARVLGTLVFAAAVYGKVRHRAEFLGVVANYHLLPQVLVRPVAWLVMGLEAVVVLSLAGDSGLAWGATLAAALLAGFAVAMAINLARGRKAIDCGCFRSTLRQPLSLAHVARNLVLAAVILPLVATDSRNREALQWLDGLAAGLVLFLLYQSFDQLMAVRSAAGGTRGRLA